MMPFHDPIGRVSLFVHVQVHGQEGPKDPILSLLVIFEQL
jgi:hypothetical protein